MRKDGRGAIDPRQHPPTPCHLPPPPAGKLLHHHCMNTRTTRKSGVFLTEFLFLSTGPVVGIDLGTHQLMCGGHGGQNWHNRHAGGSADDTAARAIVRRECK